jgi:hypothetical protein
MKKTKKKSLIDFNCKSEELINVFGGYILVLDEI